MGPSGQGEAEHQVVTSKGKLGKQILTDPCIAGKCPGGTFDGHTLICEPIVGY